MGDWIKNLIFTIKYKLGFAKEGIDFITPGLDDILDADFVVIDESLPSDLYI